MNKGYIRTGNMSIASKLCIMLLFLSLTIFTNYTLLGYAGETYLEVDQITFDENNQVRIEFNQALDTTFALNPDLFSVSYVDHNGSITYVNTTSNKITAQYDGDRVILLSLNSTPQHPFSASGIVTADIFKGAIKSSTGELYTGNELIVTSSIPSYKVSSKIMVGSQEINSDSLILNEEQAGASSITADVTVTVKDPITDAAILGLEINVKNYQHTTVTSATTDANGEATFTGLTIDGSLKRMEMIGSEPLIVTIIPNGKSLLHTSMTNRTRATITGLYDANGSKISLTSPEYMLLGYSEAYMITSTESKKLVLYADINYPTDDAWKCIASTQSLNLESGKVKTLLINIRDRNLYTRIKKNEEDNSTTLKSIKMLYITDKATGKKVYTVNANTNLPHPNEIEFWLPNDQMPDEFTIALNGYIGDTREKVYAYAPKKVFTKGITDSFSMPNSSHSSKVYNVSQTTFGYGENVYEYVYLKSDQNDSTPVDMNPYLLSLYSSYKDFENKSLYRLYENANDILLIPYKVISIVQHSALTHYYYFEKKWDDSDSLPYEASISTPLTLKADKNSVKKGEPISFQFESQSGYTLNYIRNYATNVYTYPEVTITKDSKTIAVVTNNKWDTALTTEAGTYTATITDAGAITLDDSEKTKTFEVLPFKPETPAIQSVTPGDEKVEVSWLPIDNTTGYEVYACTDMTTSSSVKVVSASQSQTNVLIDGLTNGQTYYFRVLAKSIDLNSELSDAVSGKPMPPIPNAPVLSTPTISNDTVLLSWTPTDKTDHYKIYAKTETTTSEAIQVVPSTQTNATLENLEKGKGYTFQVTATNLSGESTASNEAYLFYTTVPGAPASVVATAGNGKVTLDIGEPIDNGGSVLKGYNVTILPTNEKRTFSTSSSSIEIDQLTNGEEYSFEVSAFNNVGTGAVTVSNTVKPVAPPVDDEDDNDSSGQTPTTSPELNPPTQEPAPASVWVDGIEEKIGKQETTTQDNIKQTTISVNEADLKEKLEQKTEANPVVTLKDSTSSDRFIGTFDGSTIDLINLYKGTIEMVTDFANYKLPVDAVDWSDYNMDQVKAQVEIKTISKPLPEQLKEMGIAEIIGEPIEFSVRIYQDDKEVEVKRFKKFVGRTIETPDSRQITTAIVYEDDGTYRSVPTEVNVQGGQYTAKINSLTNSQYTLIWNPVSFSDMNDHWAKEVVNELGSRLVVSGVGNKNYAPDAMVTRAEYITALVKGLGLPVQTKAVKFTDVGIDKWYNPYVFTADDFGLIDQWRSVSKLEPNRAITRAEAAQLIENALNWSTLDRSLTEDEITQLLSGYEDYASIPKDSRKAIALCVKHNIMVGRYNQIAPQAEMTRAEMATMILKLLKVAKLI